MLKKRYHVAVATAALALLLAGCAGGGSSSSETPKGESSQSQAPKTDQSKADACKLVQEGLTEFSTLSTSMDASNPQGVIDQFKDLSARSTDTFNSITNEEVKPAAAKAATALEDYVVFLESLVADPSAASGMGEHVTALQNGITEVATVCAS